LHQSRLTVPPSADGPEPQVLSGLGQTMSPTTGGQGLRLQVDLGRDPVVHLRWPVAAPPAPPPKMTVREHYYWDLRPPGSECIAVLHYTVQGGSAAQFAVNIPDTLEPRGVEVSGEGPKAEEGTRPRIKDWRLARDNSKWRLQVLLDGPVTG